MSGLRVPLLFIDGWTNVCVYRFDDEKLFRAAQILLEEAGLPAAVPT